MRWLLTRASGAIPFRSGPKEILEADLVVVGSGPYGLVKAILALEAGLRVVVIDREPFLGGAWAARPCYGSTSEKFDMVAHLLSVYPGCYRLLEEAGFPLQERSLYFWDADWTQDKQDALAALADAAFEPRSGPAGHLMGYHQYYGLHRHADGRDAALAVSRGNRAEFEAFRYMPHSFQPLVDRLIARFETLGGQALLGASAELIRLGQQSVTVAAADWQVRAERLVSGRHLDGAIHVDGIALEMPFIANLYRSMLLLVRLSEAPRHRYVNVVGHAGMQAIQIARSAADPRPFVYSICIIDHEERPPDPEAVAGHRIAQLQAAGILPQVEEVLDVAFHRHLSRSLPREFLASVAARSPAVSFHIVDNLSQCIADNAAEWLRALGPAPADRGPPGSDLSLPG
ncbi:NAD(P)-binding protein [Bosea sp. (in: a-proteobacteria)]|uniref:FAD-dependent oxidoreductase n=1 Tax=Bosea sp. (in: a-proteobacteria) TaxID=1871050 RepID=UPI002622FC6C|nr:NAD(P)-binding protein [Bosea sp. (in: a-proteobacteria)]MCO5090672.1 FAD-dependent oxidoreductase [Bosea sp. (in: a-proteobacteria)]